MSDQGASSVERRGTFASILPSSDRHGRRLAAATALHVAHRRRVERRVLRRLPLGDDGVVRGAGALTLGGDPGRAVLVLHGFGDTPQSVAELAHALHADGWTVRVPLLPGH